MQKTAVKYKGTGHTGEAVFLTYLRTKQFFKKRLKNVDADADPFVHISQKELENRFFPWPEYSRKASLGVLQGEGLLKIEKRTGGNGLEYFVYCTPQAGKIDLSLLEKPKRNLSPLHSFMMQTLASVDILPGEYDLKQVEYFNLFLQNKTTHPDLFFIVDSFAGRVHTPITNLHSPYRKNLLLEGKPVVSFDVKQMQPLILGKILSQYVPNNDYSEWISQDHDIYEKIADKAGLMTRTEGKKRFFEILFAPPSDELVRMFGDANWINWINRVKRANNPKNPNFKAKPHSNMAWLLQSTEVEIMEKIWKEFFSRGIRFISVHDEIILKEQDRHKGEAIIRQIMDNEFNKYQLNVNK